MSVFEWESTGELGNELEFEEEYGNEVNEFGQEVQGEEFLGALGSLFGEMESPLNEMTEMELASELLEITNEEELEEFLGKLVRGVAKGVGGFIKSPAGKALGGILKNVAKKALPVVGGALGSFVAPGVGTALGSKLGSLASGLFEVELEGMDPEQAEFEVARRVVRLSAAAAKNVAQAPPNANPSAVARAAVVSAARRHAPGLVRSRGQSRRPPTRRPAGSRPRPGGSWATTEPYGGDDDGWGADDSTDFGDRSYGSSGRAQSGRWVRRGRKLIILGA
jgi:uncharacterized protein (DUF697 family)